MATNIKSSPVEVQIGGKELKLRTSDEKSLKQAAEWVNHRLDEIQKNQAFVNTADAPLFLLLELAMERLELRQEGKALLKRTDELIEWVEERLDK